MTIWSRIRHAFRRPTATKSTSWDKLWLRGIESQLTGNRITKPYRQHWAVYLAISRIATNVAQPPFVLRDGETSIPDHPLLDLLKRPNPFLSRFELWEATAVYLNLRGECFWVLGESRGQQAGTSTVPATIHVPHPDRFRPALDTNGNLTGWIYRGRVPLMPEEVVFFRFFNPYDDLRGLSPLEAARIAMETDHSAEVYNRRFFENSAEPSGVLKTQGSLTDDQFRRLLAQWEARHRGESRAHRVALLEGGLDYETLSLSHHDMAFLEQRKFSLEQILGVFGVPRSIALTQDLRYATAMVQRKAFWNDTILPHLRLIAEKLNADFIPRVAPGLTGAFDTSRIEELREDLKDKVETATGLWRMGFTANEINARLALGFDDAPWRDIAWMPLNLVPAQVAATPPESRAALPQKSTDDARTNTFRRRFLAVQQVEERLFYGKIKRFLFEQRARMLAALQPGKGVSRDTSPDADAVIARLALVWQDEGERLMLMASPLFESAVEAGATLALDTIGVGIAFDLQDPQVVRLVEARVSRITGINETIWRQIRATVRESLDAGETLDQLADRIRGIYNMAQTRSRTIARTETAGCMNEAAFDRYHEAGFTRKRWVTAHDEHTRPSHVACESQGPVPSTRPFVNGLRFPGDPDGPPEEIINCRCTLVPEP